MIYEAFEAFQLMAALRKSWRGDTSSDLLNWRVINPAWGQCAVTALIVQDHMGGHLLRAKVGDVSHYWNLLRAGCEVDLTREQFPNDTVVPMGELRERAYVLSFPDTVRRYDILRDRVNTFFPNRFNPRLS